MGQLAFELRQDLISQMKYFQFRIIASHMFKWTGLPPGLTSEKLELMLIDRGTVSLFNCAEGIFILPYSSSGHLNVYGDLLNVYPMTLSGQRLTPLDEVPRILWDNSVRQTFNVYLLAFSDRLASIQTSIGIAERQARFPSIVKMREENESSFKRFQSKIDDGYPVIYIDEAMNMENFGVFETGFRTEIFTALWNDYNKVEGEIYALLGTMFNVEQNKAAGVGPAETVMNYSQTFAIANSRLAQRQDWCEKVNAEFGFNIQCNKAQDLQDLIREVMQGGLNNNMPTTSSTQERGANANDTE